MKLKLDCRLCVGVAIWFCAVSTSVSLSAQMRNLHLSSREGRAVWVMDSAESSCVKQALTLFQSDLQAVTGHTLQICNKLPERGDVVVAGEWKKSKLLDRLTKRFHINPDSLAKYRDAFVIHPVAEKERTVWLVVGSDRRGTAYGILELSRKMGVSPWIWWADVVPERRNNLVLQLDKPLFCKPSVEYRGIFLNDEDWGLKPWASKTLEPELGEIGPRTYRRIFQLLLRLRANMVWPAMHECSKPFYLIPGNAAMADSFGIVIGTSHCEPMMRSNPGEWNHKKNGEYNYFSNREGVLNYWSERLSEVAKYENIYTVGMRGIHDGAMEGAKTVAKQVEGLERVLADQRNLLTRYLKKTPEQLPQVFIPYKEVLDAYNGGLSVPEDVTLIWCDDNYGYMTRLSNAREQARSGGAGIYYHLSYWGRPHDYLWLATTQPALIWTEMQKAWVYGARKMWIVNVGDIKPCEYLTEFFLDMAWNVDAIKYNTIHDHLRNEMCGIFGNKTGEQLADLMQEYYRLAFIRRPEFMGWSRTEPTTPTVHTELNLFEAGNEVAVRLAQYDKLMQRMRQLKKNVPERLKDAYFELVEYPVAGAALMNAKWLNRQWADVLAAYALPQAEATQRASLRAHELIGQLTTYYNDSVAGAKWKYIMSAAPRQLPVFGKPVFAQPTRLPGLSVDSLTTLLATNPCMFRDYILLSGSDFVRKTDGTTAHWESIDGLGYSNRAVLLQPFAAVLADSIPQHNPSLEYRFESSADSARIDLSLLPTRDVLTGRNVRIAVQVDNMPLQLYNIHTQGRTNVWKDNVLRNRALIRIYAKLRKGETHSVYVYAVDPDVAIDQLCIDFKPSRKLYGIGN